MLLIFGLLALAGTLLQFYDSVQGLRLAREDIAAYASIDDLKQEVRWYRPIRYARHQHAVRQLMSESPAETARYWRVQRQLIAWTLLILAAAGACLGGLLEI